MSTDQKMNPEIKVKWLERLRSGSIPQIRNLLAERRGGAGRCCLGVLCDIAVEEGVIGPSIIDETGRVLYDGERTSLPLKVLEWAGLPNNPRHEGDYQPTELQLPKPVTYPIRMGDSEGVAECITTLNDFSDLGFAGIADVIEEQL